MHPGGKKKAFLKRHYWSFLGGLGILALLLGFWGFEQYLSAQGSEHSHWDNLYLAIQLFTLESGSITGDIPWQLQISRFLSPALLAYTAVVALLELFRNQYQLYRVRFLNDHVVICGMGYKGLLLANEWRQQGYEVVGIERDQNVANSEQCKESGAIILIGNAADRGLLDKARIQSAKYLFSVCGDDGVNSEVAMYAREQCQQREQGVLTCFLHIEDVDLVNLLHEREISTQQVDAIRISFFNIYDSGARSLVTEFPPFDNDNIQVWPHILLIGAGVMGRSFLIHAARLWGMSHGQQNGKLRITLIDRQADERRQLLMLEYPQLGQLCDIAVMPMDVQSAEFHKGRFLFDDGGDITVTGVYIFLGNDSLGVSSALALRRWTARRPIQVVVSMAYETGLSSLLKGEDGSGDGYDYIYSFGLFDRTCRPDLLLNESTNEVLARAIHENYVSAEHLKGQTPESNPSMVPWHVLPDDLKESNRQQADDIGAKLAKIGRRIVTIDDWDIPLSEFSNDEIEMLAKAEHDRWVAEKTKAGWEYAEGEQDRQKKTHPDLKPWNELDKLTKDKDRNAVSALPMLLAKVGFTIETTEL